MTSPHDMALALLLNLNNGEQQKLVKVIRTITRNINATPEPLVPPTTTKSDKGSKQAKGHDKAESIGANRPGTFTMLGIVLPERNTLSAKDFIVGMRRTSDRSEQIKLIHAYVGYDPTGNFGQQEQDARSKAQKDLGVNKVAKGSRAEQLSANRSLQGFIDGLPNAHAKKLANLEGQERFFAEAKAEHLRAWNDESRPLADRLLSKGLADAEDERLSAIRADIAALAFDK